MLYIFKTPTNLNNLVDLTLSMGTLSTLKQIHLVFGKIEPPAPFQGSFDPHRGILTWAKQPQGNMPI